MNDRTIILMEDLVSLKGKPADQVTHYLKQRSGKEDGTMIDGLIKIVDMLQTNIKDAQRSGLRSGIAIGVVISSAAIVGGYLVYRHYEKTQSRKQIQEVAEILKQEVELANQEEIPVNESEVIADV